MAANCSDSVVGNSEPFLLLCVCVCVSFFLLCEHDERSFAKGNKAGCVSVSSNWVEFECFSERTRCTVEGWSPRGPRVEEEGEAIVMKESSNNVCLPFFLPLASLWKQNI